MQSMRQWCKGLVVERGVLPRRWHFLGVAAIMVATSALTACGGPSDVNNLSQPAPTAVVATVAQPYTTDSNGVLQTTVRAGAEVVLTGSSSHKGAADSGVPIISYKWQQVNAGADVIDLIRRTPDTVSFTAPEVTAETVLAFELTIADSTGTTSSANAMVTVEPIRDPNHFLQFIATGGNFAVTAATSAVVPASAGAAYNATLPFTVTVTKLVSFTDIDGTQRSMVAMGKPVTYTSGWSTPLGSGGTNCADARNPQLQIPIPRVNLDDELADGSARLSDLLETSDLDRDPANASIPPAVAYAKVEITSTALPAGATPEVCATYIGDQAIHTPAATVTASTDLLSAPSSVNAPQDSSTSAHEYYAAIDPTGSKTTLNAWLSANGFNPNTAGWAADAHAVYTNNFDLGFGRDMYMKYSTCDAGAAALPLQQRIGKCDVAAVVVNYASVQATANKLNPIVAVAMEYSATPGASPPSRFVKFYVYAPDTRTGAFERVTSVDLDRRGQRSVPQACVVCHGGTPSGSPGTKGAPDYATNKGDVAAGFLSWDLDSFYYSDTDPGFSQKPEDAALKAQFTLAGQEAQFKLLNAAAYLTTDDPKRYALERELLEGWYGGVGLPGTFDGSFVPAGWQPGGANQNPADSATLYGQVFARHCRACHVLQAPAFVNNAYVDPRTATQGLAATPACSAASVAPLVPFPPVGANQLHQIPMGCYWEFAHSPFFSAILGSGEMPFARRTLDRLWVEPDGSESAGVILQKHFAAQSPPVTVNTPGTSVAQIITPNPPGASNSAITVLAQDDLTTGAPVAVGNVVKLDSSRSSFADTIAWTAATCTGTPTNPGECATSVPVVGSTNTVAWLPLSEAATYEVTLTLDDGQGPATAKPFYYQVP
jgi:mono/diheme cytochrome c family protein